MRKFAWVYMDRQTSDLVLVQRPHRRSVGGKYRVMAGVFRRRGFMADELITVSVRSMTYAELRRQYSYFAGLNIKPRYGKRPAGMHPALGMGYDPTSQMFDDPYQAMAEEMFNDPLDG